MSGPKKLTLAVLLYQHVTALDFQGPIELLSFISSKNLPNLTGSFKLPAPLPYVIDATYLSDTTEPVVPVSGPRFHPDRTYDSVKEGEQFDILLVPGGLFLPFFDVGHQ